ncbi:hypothetical protein [Inquilinus sp. CA228]|uniref:hypothetical protein n=1 Tax=Inquilinus sp. CA228 TaxID=3455609 RepID=UPI003F8D7D02
MPDTGKRADWTYRAINMVMSAGIALGVGWVVNTLATFNKLPGQVSQLVTDVDAVKKAQEVMKQAQAGFATAGQAQTLRTDVDTLTGRVNTIETTVNGLLKPAGPKR